MKKIYSLLALCIIAISVMAQQTLPQWAQQLITLNPGVIDSIFSYPQDPKGPNTRTYIIYYNQPLKHSAPDGGRFHMRATLTVFNDADPVTAINHVYCGGYALYKQWLVRPDSLFVFDTLASDVEIAHRYHANYINLEHRYFQYSAPEKCYNNLDDLRAEEAAADFHNLFDALKKVFKGKWVMSGTSKGGITTLLQHTFYPQDFDIFVPYCAPFFNTDRDTVMYTYWYKNGWNEEYQNMFMNVRKEALSNFDKIYNIFYKMTCNGDFSQSHADSIYGSYLTCITGFGFLDHAYVDTATIRNQLYQNDSILKSHHLQYGDTVYAYMLSKCAFSLKDFKPWIDTLRKYPEPKQAPRRYISRYDYKPFAVTEAQWWGNDTIGKSEQAYEYQSKCELGYYDYRFDLIVEDPVLAAQWNAVYKKYVGCLRDLSNPYFASRTFSDNLYNQTMTATKNATKPIVFIYGFDDPWTGAAIKDEYVNGTNVHKFILPAQNHYVHFYSNTDPEKVNQIINILDGVLLGTTDRLETVTDSHNPLFDGKTYNILGMEVDENYRGIVIRNGKKYLQQ